MFMTHKKSVQQSNLSFQDAIRIKSAELWFKLGQPGQAFSELQQLPRKLWTHRSVRMLLHSP